MKLFNKEGLMIIPNPIKIEIKESNNVLVLTECYCKNGHNLVNRRVKFNDFDGIIIKLKKDGKDGLVAMSPIYGDKSRISIDLDLIERETYDFHCPECDAELPEFSPCSCGAELKALFNTREAVFANCTGVCNRVGCEHAVIHSDGELLTISMVDSI